MAIVVSDSASEESLQAYANPLSIQAKAISDLEDRVLNGNVVSDGNNVFTFLTEFSANMTATLVNKACKCFNSLYPENAQTSSDLYKHLSDFDYIGLFSTPAETTIELVFDRNFLIDNAKYVSGYTYKIVLPEYSKFTIGEYVFGLMYPIEISIRKAPPNSDGSTDYDNCVMTITWDTSTKNPLKTLESHILEHRDFVKDGQHLTAIQIPIYQFEVANHREDAIASSGFSKRYDYKGRFYAARIFHWKDHQWNEMAQSLSDIVYDVDIPTALIKVLPDISKLEVTIPQYYFNSVKSSSRIGNRLLIKIYTCSGEINLDISEYGVDQFSASFILTDTILIEDDEYSNMLKRVPTLYVLPLSSRISSGTTGLTMTELKERVKHNASYAVKITPDDLSAYFATSGYKFTRDLDNITDRVFTAHKVITDKTGTTIASGNGQTVFLPDALNIKTDPDTGELYIPDYSDISVLNTTSVTINPSAIYKYNEDEGKFYILSDIEKTALDNLSVENKVATLNSNLYTYSPFHVRLSLDPSLPIAGSYDMLNPSLRSIVFDWENSNVTAQMAVYSADIAPLEDNNKKGYRLSVAVFKTSNISSVNTIVDLALPDRNIQVMLSTTTSRGVYEYMLGTYNGKDASGHDIFLFDITTTFKITSDGMIDATSMTNETGETAGNFLDMGTRTYSLSFFIAETALKKLNESILVSGKNYAMQDVDTTGVPGSLDGFVYLCRQNLKLTLGSSLPLLQNNVSLNATDVVYQTYPTTEFDTYRAPVYDRWTAYDYNHQVIDPVTGLPVVAKKIGTLKMMDEYYLTTDTTFQSGKTYYTRSGTAPNYTYTVAVVTVGNPVPMNTYYEHKLSLSIKHNTGDVITSSRYGYTYGVVTTASYTKDDTDVTLSMTLNEPMTVTSSPANVWTSVDDDLYISGTDNTRFTGIYTRMDRSAVGVARVWKQSTTSNIEMFDTTTLHPIQEVFVYKYVNAETGEVIYSATTPPLGVEYEIISSVGSYLSSNSDTVKADPYVASAMNTTVNTSARGYDRKWFWSGEDDKFKFSTYTGFVVEYSPVGTDNTGIVSKWNLSYYYQTINAATGTRERNVLVLIPDVLSSNFLTTEDKTYLTQDSYISSYQEIYHILKFNGSVATSSSMYGWVLYETVDPNGANALVPYYHAHQIGGTVPIEEPEDAEWAALTEGDTSFPVIKVLTKNAPSARMEVKEALTVIKDYITSHSTHATPASSLYRYIDQGKLTTDTVVQEEKDYYSRTVTTSRSYPYTYTKLDLTVGTPIPANTYELVPKFTVDPLPDKVFVCVPTTDDSREQEFCNSEIGYCPGIADPVYSDRALEVGVTTAYGYVLTGDTVFEYGKQYYRKTDGGAYYFTVVTVGDPVPANTYYERHYTTGKGAIYYRDVDASNIDYTTYNLDEDAIVAIIASWNLHATESTAKRYKSVAADTGVAVNILRKIVSDTEPCYISPWKKLVNVSSFEAFVYYQENRTIVNCKINELIAIQNTLKSGYVTYALSSQAAAQTVTEDTYVFISDITDMNGYMAWASESLLGSSLRPTCAFAKLSPTAPMSCVMAGISEEMMKKNILAYSVYSGYMYVLSTGLTPTSLSDTFYHYTSRIPRIYTQDDGSELTRTEFNINFETTLWSEIDSWPWEVDDIWLDVTTGRPISLGFTFDNELSCARVKHMNTDVMLDANGDPIISTDGKRSTKYEIDMLHCDYKLALSNDADYVNYTNDVRELLRSYFNELNTISPSLLARTKMYFTPIRTFGTSTFKGSGGNDLVLPLEFAVNIGLHVESYVNGNDLNKDTIRENILKIIDTRLKEGYLNLAILAKDIMADLSDNIICVDVLGINGNNTLQTMIPATDDCFPQLKQYLILGDDGSIHTDRRLEITWYVIN